MIKAAWSAVVCLLVACAVPVRGNQLAYLQAEKADYSFPDHSAGPDSGEKFVVRMEQTGGKVFLSIRIDAFGKTHEVPKPLLKELSWKYTCQGLTALKGTDPFMKCRALYLQLGIAVFEQAGPPAVIVVGENGEIVLRQSKK